MTERVVFDCDGCGKSNVEVKRLRAIEAAAREWAGTKHEWPAEEVMKTNADPFTMARELADYYAAEDRLREVLK